MINLGNNYSIGLTNPPTKLTQFGIPDPFPTEFNLSAFPPKRGGDGLQFFSGKPQAKWKFGMLDQRELNVLLGYVSGASSQVYIRTKILTIALSMLVQTVLDAKSQFSPVCHITSPIAFSPPFSQMTLS